MINIDAMSMIGLSRDLVVVGYGNSQLDDYLKAAAQGQDRVVVPEPTPENGFYFRSDHFNFAKQGVPRCTPRAAGPRRARRRIRPAPGRRVQPRALPQPGRRVRSGLGHARRHPDLEALYHVAEAIANSSDWPQWSDSSEFQAAGQELLPAAAASRPRSL